MWAGYNYSNGAPTTYMYVLYNAQGQDKVAGSPRRITETETDRGNKFKSSGQTKYRKSQTNEGDILYIYIYSHIGGGTVDGFSRSE